MSSASAAHQSPEGVSIRPTTQARGAATGPLPVARASSPTAASSPTPPAKPSASHAYLTIGQVIDLLSEEFAGVTISKIRFLESEGLVEPQRTESNYRKFSRGDVERLRYVLRIQRDHYLPLRVIREHLESMDRGFDPPLLVGGPQVPESEVAAPETTAAGLLAKGPDLRMSRRELLGETGLSDTQLRELETFGLVEARDNHFDSDALDVARTAATLARVGNIGGRHLARFRNAVDRELDLCAQVVAPVRKQRDPEARARAEETAAELAALFVQLHTGLVRSGLRRALDGS